MIPRRFSKCATNLIAVLPSFSFPSEPSDIRINIYHLKIIVASIGTAKVSERVLRPRKLLMSSAFNSF